MKYKFFLILLVCVSCNRKEFLNPNDPLNIPPAPIPTYPMESMIVYDNPPRFYWLSLDTLPVVCEIQVAYNSNFDKPVFSVVLSSQQDTFSYRPEEPLEEHCFWRVRAKREEASDNAWGEWSSTVSFKERFPLVGKYEEIPASINTSIKMVIKDNYAYVFDYYDNTFHILDVSNPTNPELLVSFTDSAVYEFYNMVKDGSYLYFYCSNKDYDYYLRIYSVSNPSSPQFVGACSLANGSGAIDISYPAVYVTQSNIIDIIDVSDPANPQICGTIAEYVYDLIVKDDYLILATSSEIKIYNIADPFHPFIENSYSLNIYKFCISGDTLVTINSYAGSNKITIFDISALPVIQEVDSFSTPYPYYGSNKICFSNNCVIVGNYIFELKAGSSPEKGWIGIYPYDIAVDKGYLYMLEDGIWILKL